MVPLRKSTNSSNARLRNKAEQMISQDKPTATAAPSPENVAEMLHELQVHQIELEVQNEELRKTQLELQVSRDAFANLYEFAPVGYITLDRSNRLVNVNYIACRMLGVDKTTALRTTLSRFIVPNDTDSFYFCMKDALESNRPAICQVKMKRADKSAFNAELRAVWEAISEGEPRHCRVAIIDNSERIKSEEELKVYRDHLEEVVVERTRELRELSHRLIEVQEKERTSIGSDLHDDIGQLLTYATLLISQAERKPDQDMLSQARSTIQQAIAKTRDLSSMLSPGILHSDGLSMAVECFLSDFNKRSGIEVDFSHDPGVDRVPADAALAAYRIIQEALTNVVRHAAASKVIVALRLEPGKLHLMVADNGMGFDAASTPHSVGLTGMRERARAQGGEFKIGPGDGRGTKIAANFPIPELKDGLPT